MRSLSRRFAPSFAFIWLILFLAFLPTSSEALDPRKLNSQYMVKEWTMEEGMADNYVQAIAQTRDGYLWLGTQNSGILRFDGVRFSRYLSHSNSTPQDLSIRAFRQRSDGSMWIGTDGAGLWRYHNGQLRVFTVKDGLMNDHIRALHEDRSGNLWVAIGGGNLVRVLPNQSIAAVKSPQPLGSIYSFCEDQEGGIWMVGDGLWYFKDAVFHNIREKFQLAQQMFTDVCVDRDQSVWIATTYGLLHLQDGQIKHFTEMDGLSDSRLREVHVDRDGNLWIGSNSGLDRYHNGEFTSCLTRERVPVDLVYCITEDQEGSLWVGTNGGLLRIKDDKFSYLTTKEGLSQNIVMSMIQARDESFWVGTWTRGVTHLKNNEATIYDTRSGLSDDQIRCIHEDREGIVWVGTEEGGLNAILLNQAGEGAIQSFGHQQGLRGKGIAIIQDDPEGHLWVVDELGRPYRFLNNMFHPIQNREGMIGSVVQIIHQTSRGDFWVATDKGLNLWRGGQWQTNAYSKELTSTIIRWIYEDRQGSVWMCTSQGGLVRFDKGKFSVYTKGHGLVHDSPYAVMEDEHDQLWVACKVGLFQVRRSDFDRLDAGEIQRLNVMDYTMASGMRNPRFIRKGYPMATRLSDGRLCFPTTKGVTIVTPDPQPHQKIVPPVVIEQIVLDRKTISPAAQVELHPRSRDLEIHYTALSLRSPERVRFKYRLDRYDSDWVDAGSRRIAYYQNLPPGKYQFEVMAANEEGLWNPESASISFVQQPVFYQTTPFYAVCAFVLAGSSWLVHRQRINQAKRRFAAMLEERTRIARDLHDTLEQGLVGISMQLNLASAKFSNIPAVAQQHMEKARYMLRHSMADARSAILNLRSNAAEEDKDLLQEFSRIANELTDSTEINVKTEMEGVPFRISPFARHTLIRICQEAMTNVIKHAGAKMIEVFLVYEEHRIRLRVRDNGKGFDAEKTNKVNGGRYGLLGMRERAEKLGGEFLISSAPRMGTTIEVIIPERKAALSKLE